MELIPGRTFNGRHHGEMTELDDLERHDEHWGAPMTFDDLKKLRLLVTQNVARADPGGLFIPSPARPDLRAEGEDQHHQGEQRRACDTPIAFVARRRGDRIKILQRKTIVPPMSARGQNPPATLVPVGPLPPGADMEPPIGVDHPASVRRSFTTPHRACHP
jgi:hypothetical protein